MINKKFLKNRSIVFLYVILWSNVLFSMKNDFFTNHSCSKNVFLGCCIIAPAADAIIARSIRRHLGDGTCSEFTTASIDCGAALCIASSLSGPPTAYPLRASVSFGLCCQAYTRILNYCISSEKSTHTPTPQFMLETSKKKLSKK